MSPYNMRAAITLAIMFGWMTSAHAGNDIGVVVGGDTTKHAQISAQVKDWLRRHGHKVVAAPLPAASIAAFVDCLGRAQPDCARQIVDEKARASTVVYVQVDETRAETLTMIVYWFDKGKPAVSERRACDRCTSAALIAAIDALLAELLRGIPSMTGHVKLRSSPSGARITVDGEPVGLTPLDWDLAPGKHTIGMGRDQQELGKRTVVVGANATVVVEMSRPETPRRAWQGRDDSVLARALPPAAMATGAAAVIAGSILIAIDQNNHPSAPRMVDNSAPVGFAVSIAGVALAGVGAYLWFRRSAASASPVAAVTGNAAYMGWAGRF